MFLFPEEDDEKEQKLQRILTKRHSDLKRTTDADVDYPHTCTCGYSAFYTSRPHCTNRNCKWYDHKLKRGLLDANPAIEPGHNAD